MRTKRIPALAVALAVGATSTIAPAVVLPTAATAAEGEGTTSIKKGVQASDVKIVSFTDNDGNTFTEGDIYTQRRANKSGKTGLHVISSYKSPTVTVSIDLSNAKGGDILNFGIVSTFDVQKPEPKKLENTLYAGTLFDVNSNTAATVDGKNIGQLKVQRGSYARLTFNDGVNSISKGTLDVDIPIRLHNLYIGESREPSAEPIDIVEDFLSWTGKRNLDTAIKAGDVSRVSLGVWSHFESIVKNTTADRIAFYNLRPTDVFTDKNGGSNYKNLTFEAPVGADFEVELRPETSDKEGGVPWRVDPNNITVGFLFKEYTKDGAPVDKVNNTEYTPEQLKKRTGVEVKTDFGLTENKQTVRATVTGTPANYKPYVEFRTKDGKNPIGYSSVSAAEKRMLVAQDSYTPLNDAARKGRDDGTIYNYQNTLTSLPSFRNSDLSTYTFTADISAHIKGHTGNDSGLSVNTPARGLNGKTGEFTFTIKNTGTYPLINPTVTLPDGSIVSPTKLKEYGNEMRTDPGHTGTVTVPYAVPGGAAEARLSISYPTFNINGTGNDTFSQTFYFTDKKSVEQLIEDGNKEQGDKLDKIAESIKDGNENTNKHLDDINGELDKIGKDTKRQADALDKIREETEKQTTALDNIKDNTKTLSDEAKKQSEYLKGIDGDLDTIKEEVTKHTTALNTLADQSKKQTENLGKINTALEELGKKYDTLNDTQKKQLEQLKNQVGELAKQNTELARQTAELKRQSDSQAQIVDQLKRLADQQDVAAGNEKHRDYVGRCLATNSGFAVSLILPIAAAIAGSNPGVQDMFNSASRNISDMLGASSNPAVVDFNNRYGGMIQAGLQGIGGVLAVLATAGAITGFVNDCYQKADEETGRDIIDRPTMSSELEWIGTPDHNKNGFAPAAKEEAKAE